MVADKVALTYVKSAGIPPRRAAFVLIALLVGLAAAGASSQTPSARDIAARADRAVVSITARNRWGEEIGTGTGFFVDDRGTFVTNHHVLEGASELTVELAGGERFNLVYTLVLDVERDIAILSVPAERTPALVLGSDQELEVGDTVYVMGNPLGLDRTFSNGLVSAKRILDGSEVIQITAPISPGSSGGPVMNGQGEVIGVATWYTEGGQNLNMAIPMRYVRPLLSITHAPALFEGDAEPVPLVASEVTQPTRRRAARIDVQVGDQWNQQVLRQLAAAENAALSARMVRSHEPVTGRLDDGESGIVRIRLEGSYGYLFMGACDEDCSDLDLFLYDDTGRLLAAQEEVTDVPVLEYAAPFAAELTLRVRMYSCNVEPCAYGVATFRER
jgi:hypothetical protein